MSGKKHVIAAAALRGEGKFGSVRNFVCGAGLTITP